MEGRSGVDLFRSLSLQPCTTVFADPPASFRNHRCSQALKPASACKSIIEIGDTTNENHFDSCAKDTSQTRSLTSHNKIVKPVRRADKVPWWVAKRRKDEKLWLAAETGNLDSLRILLQSPKNGDPPANVDSRSLYGRTPLHIVASTGRTDCMKLLLAARANLEAQTDAGFTALHIASQSGHTRATTLLLEKLADPLSQTTDWNLALHLAASRGRKEIVVGLLEASNASMSQQLRSRNSLGQLAAETSLDVETAEIFQHFDVMASQISSDHPNDNYAARTIYYEGGVLLPNSRADAVRQVLDKVQRFATIPIHRKEGFVFAQSHSRISRFLRRISGRSADPNCRVCIQPRPSNGSRKSRQSFRASFIQLRGDKPPIEKVGLDSFEFVRVLGKGSFGEVLKVMHKRSGEVFAMKVQPKERAVKENLLRYAVTERNVLCFVRHPYIVALHFAFQTPTYLILVLKFCPGGSLQDLIEKEKAPEPLARLYIAEVLLGLICLHERSIIYRDLKPENVILDEERHAVLTDFGLSKEGVFSDNNRTFCGSLAYLAPEILRRQGHGRMVDLYGLGTLLYALFTRFPPFYHKDKNVLFSNIQYARLHFRGDVPPIAQRLITGLMERDPSRRIGAACTADAKDHAFFASVDFDLLMERRVPVPEMFMTEAMEPAVGNGQKTPLSGRVRSHSGDPDFVANWSWQRSSGEW